MEDVKKYIMSVIEKKIIHALSRSVCGGWDRGFLESILQQLAKGGDLSVKQREALGKVLARNTQEDQVNHGNWAVDYENEYSANARILAHYHSRQPYYREMAKDILAGYVPEQNKFMRMHNNKYSKKVLREAVRDPRFDVGNYVIPRTTFDSYKNCEFQNDMIWIRQNEVIKNFQKRGGFVIKICPEIYSAAKGAKRYTLLPIGEVVPIIVEERFLKVGKQKPT
jgi:hypothetical protein